MNPIPSGGRFRAYIEFLFAILYFLAAKMLAQRWIHQARLDQGSPLAEQAILALLLLFGFALMGIILSRQSNPISAQGWPFRKGFPGEIGLGLTVGWGLAVACVLPLALFGGIAIRISGDASAWRWLLADAAFFALSALNEEVAFRGYAFQRFAAALSGVPAALAFAVVYAILQNFQRGSSTASLFVSMALGLLLSTAYLRTKALWLSWGLNFAWKASRALLFGLAISGDNSHTPVVQGDPMGPFWITGGGFGLDGTWIAFFVVLAAIPVLYRLTRELDFRWNAPVIVPGGIPVDIDAAAQRQHETAMGPSEPAPQPLVQIQPAGIVQQEGPPNQGEPDDTATGAGPAIR